jgi:2'-5' RNA ligase
MARLFVAVWPTAEVIEHLRAVPRDSWVDVRWIPERNWHVTLRFIGEATAEDTIEALAAVELPVVSAQVSMRIERLGGRSVVVPVDGVDTLARAVREATEGIGTDALDPHFRGHITLGRSRGKRPIKGGIATADPPPPIRFDVQEVALVASTLTDHGSDYEPLASFPTLPTSARPSPSPPPVE